MVEDLLSTGPTLSSFIIICAVKAVTIAKAPLSLQVLGSKSSQEQNITIFIPKAVYASTVANAPFLTNHARFPEME